MDTAVEQLVAILGDAVRTDPVTCENYRFDWSRDPTAGVPIAVVRPANAGQVQTTIRWAAEHRVPVVPRGAGSGLSGGSSAVSGGIVVSLERMRAIEIDLAARVAVAEPGASMPRSKRPLRSRVCGIHRTRRRTRFARSAATSLPTPVACVV